MFKSALCENMIFGFVEREACSNDGGAQKAGESIDKATGHTDKYSIDALHEATNDDPNKQP